MVLGSFAILKGSRGIEGGLWGMFRGMRGCERENWEFGGGGMAYIF